MASPYDHAVALLRVPHCCALCLGTASCCGPTYACSVGERVLKWWLRPTKTSRATEAPYPVWQLCACVADCVCVCTPSTQISVCIRRGLVAKQECPVCRVPSGLGDIGKNLALEAVAAFFSTQRGTMVAAVAAADGAFAAAAAAAAAATAAAASAAAASAPSSQSGGRKRKAAGDGGGGGSGRSTGAPPAPPAPGPNPVPAPPTLPAGRG